MDFLVIGFYPDTRQRFAEPYSEYDNADDAERAALRDFPGLTVCAVVGIDGNGKLSTFDIAETIAEG